MKIFLFGNALFIIGVASTYAASGCNSDKIDRGINNIGPKDSAGEKKGDASIFDADYEEFKDANTTYGSSGSLTNWIKTMCPNDMPNVALKISLEGDGGQSYLWTQGVAFDMSYFNKGDGAELLFWENEQSGTGVNDFQFAAMMPKRKIVENGGKIDLGKDEGIVQTTKMGWYMEEGDYIASAGEIEIKGNWPSERCGMVRGNIMAIFGDACGKNCAGKMNGSFEVPFILEKDVDKLYGGKN